jgi:beta-glucosidase
LAISQLEAAVAHGLTNASIIQVAFGRLMRVRIRLGMFDPPTLLPRYNQLGEKDLQTAASTALNRRAAASGMVLLKNGAHGGKALLPLDATALLGVAGAVSTGRSSHSDTTLHI